jgi:hypothetical protein
MWVIGCKYSEALTRSDPERWSSPDEAGMAHQHQWHSCRPNAVVCCDLVPGQRIDRLARALTAWPRPTTQLWLLKIDVHNRYRDLHRHRRSHSMSTPRILTFLSTASMTRMWASKRVGASAATPESDSSL